MAEIGQGHANFLARSTNIAEYSTNVRNLQGGMPILLYPTMTHPGYVTENEGKRGINMPISKRLTNGRSLPFNQTNINDYSH